jgi:hypothetical protein
VSITELRTPAEAQSPRLRLEPTSSRTTLLDGGWWPRSNDAGAELPPLIAALDSSRGLVSHVLLNIAEWSLPHPRRITVDGRAVRLGWFTSQPTGLLTLICEFGRDRIDLLVVPVRATAAGAATAMTAAATTGNRLRTPALLADVARED